MNEKNTVLSERWDWFFSLLFMACAEGKEKLNMAGRKYLEDCTGHIWDRDHIPAENDVYRKMKL